MIRLIAWWLREKTLLSGTAVRIPVWHYFSWTVFFFILFSFHLIFSSFCINLDFFIRKSSQILLNQTDVAVVEELEKVIINIYSSTETDIGDNEYASGETTETSSETEACLPLGLRLHTVPNVEIKLKLIVLHEIRWNWIKSL